MHEQVRPDDVAPHRSVLAKLGWINNMPYWGVSALIHMIVMLVLINIVWQVEEAAERDTQVVISVRPLKSDKAPAPYRPQDERDIVENPHRLPTPTHDEEVQSLPLIDIEEPVTDDPWGTDERNKTNISIALLNPDGTNSTIGIGGGPVAEQGTPIGVGDRERSDGPPRTSSAIRAALEWLRRHQHPDGHWSAHDYTELCDKTLGPCKSDPKLNAFTDGRGDSNYDVGVTALAMLAYLGTGHTHRDGRYPEYVDVMRRALDWMLKQQQRSSDPQSNGVYGRIGACEDWVYNHAIATMAMAELLMLSRDRVNLRNSVQAATEYVLGAQNPGSGWRYKYRGGASDSSVTGWMVLALKAAKICADSRLINVEADTFRQSFAGAMSWFDRVTSQANGKAGYQAPGDSGSQLNNTYPEPYPFSKNLSCMTAVSVLCRLFSGEKRSSEAVKRGIELLTKSPPTWRPHEPKRPSSINIYYWYYASYAMFQYGGPAWDTWNEAMLAALVPTQRVLGEEDGSWDPVDEWSAIGGRVYTTALGAMTLQVYDRYLRAK
ncbi:MAG: hypothetical protein ACKVX7_20505 [Planctomycetota bacterium]